MLQPRNKSTLVESFRLLPRDVTITHIPSMDWYAHRCKHIHAGMQTQERHKSLCPGLRWRSHLERSFTTYWAVQWKSFSVHISWPVTSVRGPVLMHRGNLSDLLAGEFTRTAKYHYPLRVNHQSCWLSGSLCTLQSKQWSQELVFGMCGGSKSVFLPLWVMFFVFFLILYLQVKRSGHHISAHTCCKNCHCSYLQQPNSKLICIFIQN